MQLYFIVNISDCLKEEFKEHSLVGKTYHLYFGNTIYKYPNCTLPWHQSMLGIFQYNDADVTPCNQTEFYALWWLDYTFLQEATTGGTKCLGKYYIRVQHTNTIRNPEGFQHATKYNKLFARFL